MKQFILILITIALVVGLVAGFYYIGKGCYNTKGKWHFCMKDDCNNTHAETNSFLGYIGLGSLIILLIAAGSAFAALVVGLTIFGLYKLASIIYDIADYQYWNVKYYWEK